jgi:hypothetical protein
MPAIRYVSGISVRINHCSALGDWCDAYLKDGSIKPVRWFGFICKHATALLPGKPVKLSAMAITDGDGGLESEWKILGPNETAIGWLCEVSGKTRSLTGIYGIVDDSGWPLTTGHEPDYSPKKKAPVIEIGARKRATG